MKSGTKRDTLGNDYGSLHEAQQAGLAHYLDRVRKVVLPQLSLPSPGLDSAHLIAQRDAAEARAKVLQQFIETLLAFQPSEAQLAGAALSFRHDLGLLSDDEQRKTMQVGMFWLQAWQHELRTMRQASLPSHPDNQAVDRFARAMQRKLALKRTHGRGGWRDPSQCSAAALSRMLREHVDKGDPIDVANFCMMLHQRGEHISMEETQ